MPTSSPSPRAIAPTAASLNRNAQRRPTTPSSTSSSTSSLMMNLPAGLVVGARVFLPGSKAFGSVRFLGETSFQADTWVGVELDQPMGRNSGEVQGRKYFDCLPSHGIFVRPTNCIPLMEETLSQDEHHHQRTSLGPKAQGRHKPIVGGTTTTAAVPMKQPRATTPSSLQDDHPRFSTSMVSTYSPPPSLSSLPRVVKPITSTSRSPPSSTTNSNTTNGRKISGNGTSTPITSTTTTTTSTPNISYQNNDVKGNDKSSGISTPEQLLSGGLLEEKLLVELLVEMVTNSELLQTKISEQVGDEVQQHARAEVKAVEEKLMREMQGMTSLVGERLQGLEDQIVQTMGTIAEKNQQQGEATDKERLQEKEALNAILEFASETKQRLLADMQERSDSILALRKLVTEEEEDL